jgi:hypothetical protein
MVSFASSSPRLFVATSARMTVKKTRVIERCRRMMTIEPVKIANRIHERLSMRRHHGERDG